MAYVLWRADPDQAREAFLAGEPADVVESEYGLNEHLFQFLRERGWWEHLTAFQPLLGKENGKSPQALNGAWVMVNLVHLGHLEHADPLLCDGSLMMEAGFTLREVQRAGKLEQGVVHRDTLRNHCKRIAEAESDRVFYEHVDWMRRQKGLRGQWYAVDGFRLEVTGKQYEGAGRVWDDERKEWVRGYKVVLILNVSDDRERIVGLALGPIQSDERQLLRKILKGMRSHGLEPKEMIEGLILDRGYWGAGFLRELWVKWGLHWCTLVPANVQLHEVVGKLLAEQKLELRPRTVTYRSGRQEHLQIGAVKEVVSSGENGEILLTNLVLARRVSERTGEIHDRLFATNVAFSKQKPHQVVARYSERWAIENEGIRELSQRWRARVPIGRKFSAIYAQLVMLAMCYNAMKDYAMKKPKEAHRLQLECRKRARRSYLTGQTNIVFILRRRIFMVTNMRVLAEMSQERTLRRLEYLIARGLSAKEAMAKARQEGILRS